METAMKFAKWVFLIAGIYGILVVAPQYFSESRIARDFPPAITHPEYLYSLQRVAALAMGFAAIDLILGILFLLAFLRAPKVE
jgi:hypothetical protein